MSAKHWIEQVWADLRFGLRTQAKAPAPSIAVVLTLALGIAATSLSFTITNSLFLSALPVADPARLVRIYGSVSSLASMQRFVISNPDVRDIRAQHDVFAGVVAEQPVPYSLGSPATSERIWGELATADYFSVLGVRPEAGRFFSRDEETLKNGPPVAILSAGLSERLFAGAHAAIGATILLNNHPVRVVGVVPPRFHGTMPGLLPDVWIPVIRSDQLYPVSYDWLEDRGARSFFVVGRLQPGVTPAQARGTLDALGRRLQDAFPRTNKGVRFTVMTEAESRVHPMVARELLGASTVSLAVALLVLLIACANVAGVLMVRASARRREIGVRLAVGATRPRVIRQLITEHASLSIAAGLIGLVTAFAATKALNAVRLPLNLPMGMDFPVDARVLGFGFVITVTAGILFGVAPAWIAAQCDPLMLVKDGDAAEAPAQSRARSAFVAAQVALSILLVIGGGLFFRSLQHAQRTDIGFVPDGVVMTSVDLGLQNYSGRRAQEFWDRLTVRLAAIPEVESSSVITAVPFQLNIVLVPLAPVGYALPADGGWPTAESAVADKDYFATMRIPLIEGREFNEHDDKGAPDVVIVNDVYARQFWPDGRAAGRRVTDRQGKIFEVIGVVPRGKYLTLGEAPRPYVYFARRQTATRAASVVARGGTDPRRLLRDIGAAVHALDPAIPLYDVKTVAEHVGIALAPAKSGAGALGIIGVVALLLTSLGLYGTVAQAVARRTYEIGIRRALGAQDLDVARLVVEAATRLVIIGMICGAILASGAARLIRTVLYDVDAFDPVVIASALAILLVVSVVAAWIPTRRAIRVEAATALRYQ